MSASTIILTSSLHLTLGFHITIMKIENRPFAEWPVSLLARCHPSDQIQVTIQRFRSPKYHITVLAHSSALLMSYKRLMNTSRASDMIYCHATDCQFCLSLTCPRQYTLEASTHIRKQNMRAQRTLNHICFMYRSIAVTNTSLSGGVKSSDLLNTM